MSGRREEQKRAFELPNSIEVIVTTETSAMTERAGTEHHLARGIKAAFDTQKR
jgi:hypothetical protein